MGYELLLSPEALDDIDEAFEYYLKFSVRAVNLFDWELRQIFHHLKLNPFFQIRYKNIRAIPFKSLPYLVFFEVDEKNKKIFIYSVFNTYLNPEKYPKR